MKAIMLTKFHVVINGLFHPSHGYFEISYVLFREQTINISIFIYLHIYIS